MPTTTLLPPRSAPRRAEKNRRAQPRRPPAVSLLRQPAIRRKLREIFAL